MSLLISFITVVRPAQSGWHKKT